MKTLIAIAILLLSFPLQAATFYVRLAGSDANCNGTVNVDDSVGVRPNCAERNITAAKNDAVTAGDIVHIGAGTWNENVSGFNSGSAGNPITFEGEGTLGANTIWTHPGGGKDSLTNGVVYIANKSYIRFRTIKFDGTDTKAVIYGLANDANGLKGIEIRSCTISNNGNRGVDLDPPAAGISHTVYFNQVNPGPNQDHVIDSNVFDANKGISVHLIRPSNSTVSNNTFKNLQASQYSRSVNNSTFDAEGIHFGTGGSGNTISGNTFQDFVRDSYIPANGGTCNGGPAGTALCQYNAWPIKYDTGTSGDMIKQNTIFNINVSNPGGSDGTAIYLESGNNNTTILNNVVYNVSKDGIHVGSPATGVATGNIIDGNVLYNCGCSGIAWVNASSGSAKNNIIYLTVSGASGVRDTTISSGIVYKNNLYFRTAGTNMSGWNLAQSVCTPNNTYAAWVSSSGETGSVNADPLFVTNGSNFHLQGASPAIHAGDLGQDLGAYPLGNPPPTSTISLTFPNGGNDLVAGTVANITWQTTQTGGCKVEVARDGATFNETLTASTTCTNQTYAWTVTPPGRVCMARFKITSLLDGAVTDTSDADVSIHGSRLSVLP